MKNALVLPVLIVGLSLGAAGTIGVRKIREWIAEKKQTQLITEQEAAEAEEYLKGELTDAIETLEPVTDGDTTSSTSRCTTMGTEKNDP